MTIFARERDSSLPETRPSIPLYAFMAIVTGIAFTFFMDYSMGQGIYLGLLIEFSGIFLNLALFIWAGMLLTQTRVMDLFLAVLRPWNLAPETLTWLILIGAAIPTAYTKTSGIFVVGAVRLSTVKYGTQAHVVNMHLLFLQCQARWVLFYVHVYL